VPTPPYLRADVHTLKSCKMWTCTVVKTCRFHGWLWLYDHDRAQHTERWMDAWLRANFPSFEPNPFLHHRNQVKPAPVMRVESATQAISMFLSSRTTSPPCEAGGELRSRGTTFPPRRMRLGIWGCKPIGPAFSASWSSAFPKNLLEHKECPPLSKIDLYGIPALLMVNKKCEDFINIQ
jgi:hypothetical protein